jgi:hypothetical protein
LIDLWKIGLYHRYWKEPRGHRCFGWVGYFLGYCWKWLNKGSLELASKDSLLVRSKQSLSFDTFLTDYGYIFILFVNLIALES